MFRLFFGLGLGYLIGTLFAPGKGSVIREELRKKIDDLRDNLKSPRKAKTSSLKSDSRTDRYAMHYKGHPLEVSFLLSQARFEI